MSEAEIIELIILVGATAGSQFEFWMATTFAVAVASYSAGSRLNIWLRIAITILYIAACILFYLRYLEAVNNLSSLFGLLHEMGSIYRPGNITLMIWMRQLVAVGTTVLAIILILRPSISRSHNADRSNSAA